jgi:Domain of unknown function (DUF3576)
MTRRGRTIWPAAVALAVMMAVSGCASNDGGAAEAPRSRTGVDDPGSGISVPFFGGGGGNRNQQANQIGVNSFLWRAALDTLSFMPLASNDPFGGVIITDWRIDPNAPTERFKMTVYILDTRLRADGVKVNVFKQVNGVNGWVDAAVDPDTPIQIENAILTRARQLRLSTLGEK